MRADKNNTEKNNTQVALWHVISKENYREIKTTRSHMIPPPQHARKGLARPAYEFIMARN